MSTNKMALHTAAIITISASAAAALMDAAALVALAVCAAAAAVVVVVVVVVVATVAVKAGSTVPAVDFEARLVDAFAGKLDCRCCCCVVGALFVRWVLAPKDGVVGGCVVPGTTVVCAANAADVA